MLFFNSVTGKIEDDGKELAQPGMLSIPAGRAVNPDGSQDIQIPMDGMFAQDQYERQTSKQNDLAMMENPEAYPYSKMFDFQNSMMPSESGPMQSLQPEVAKPMSQGNRKPAVIPENKNQPSAKEMNPEVKKYIMEKYKISEDLSEEAYRDAQRAGSKNNFNLNLAEAANDIGSAIAGVKSNNQYYDKLRTQANDGEKNILSARKFENESRNERLQVDKLNREQDVNSEESKLARTLAKQMVPSMDFSNMSASQINEKIPSLQKIYEIKVKQQENQLNRENQSFLRNQVLGQQAQARTDKKMTMMNDIEDRRQNMNTNLSKLKSMIDEDGTYEMFGSHNQDIDRLTEQIATDMAKLMDPNSVARPAEVEAIKKTLVRPGFSNTNSTAQEILKNFEDEINTRADSAYKIRGLESPSGRPQASEGNQSNRGPQSNKIRVSNGKETLMIDPEDLADAEADGFKKVK